MKYDLRIMRVHGDLVFCGVTDQPLGVGERDIGRGCTITLVVGDDLNTIVLPDTNTPILCMMRRGR